MARFECSRCGKCCMSLGACITIVRQLSDRDFYCRNSLTGEIFPVRIPADSAGVVEVEPPGSNGPNRGKSCAFMRKDPEGPGFSCMIYQNRPAVCREFRCYRMLIYNERGEQCATIVGRNTLLTSDPVLEKIWAERISGIRHEHPANGNDPAWVKSVTSVLAQHGYRVEPAV